jgi:hypothetical protein
VLFIGVSICWGIMFHTDSTQQWKAMVLLVIHGLAGVIWIPASQVLIHRIVAIDQLPSAVRLNATGRYLAFPAGSRGRRACCCCVFWPVNGIFINALIYVPMFVWLIKAPYGPERAAAPRGRKPCADLAISGRPCASCGRIQSSSSMTVMIGASAFFIGNAYQAQMPGFAPIWVTASVGCLAYS